VIKTNWKQQQPKSVIIISDHNPEIFDFHYLYECSCVYVCVCVSNWMLKWNLMSIWLNTHYSEKKTVVLLPYQNMGEGSLKDLRRRSYWAHLKAQTEMKKQQQNFFGENCWYYLLLIHLNSMKDERRVTAPSFIANVRGCQ
jgi:hypothetical protein